MNKDQIARIETIVITITLITGMLLIMLHWS